MTTTLSPSGLRFHEYTDPNWPDDLAYNIGRLNTTLLKVERMGDVNLGPLSYRDGLKWDASGSEYVNYAVMVSTTTSTQSSTTTSSSSTTSSTASSTSSTAPGATTTTTTTSTSTSSSSSTTATFTTTTAIPAPEYEAKSVILDILDNYSGSNWTGIRSIDFWYQGSKIANIETTDFTAYVTNYSSLDYLPSYAVDTSLSKTGAAAQGAWQTAFTGDQRLSIVFTNLTTFDEIRINNFHNSGGSTLTGSKNVKIHFSTDAISSIVYEEAITNSTLIFDGIFDEHSAVDAEDEQTLVIGEIIPATTTSTSTTTTTSTSSSTSTTAVPGLEFTAKSVVLDIHTHWGDINYMSIRQVDFWYQGSKIDNIFTTDFVSYQTSAESGYEARYGFDTTTNKIGASVGAGYYSGIAAARLTNRMTCVFNSETTFDEIRINNGHESGSATTRGAKDVKIYTSSDAITSTIFDEAIPNSSLIYDGIFDQHVASNIEDEETLILQAPTTTTSTSTTTTSSTTSTTAIPGLEFTAKSVILDIADGIGATYLGVRQIDFWYQGSKITALEADYTAYDTNHYSTVTMAKFAFDTSTSKIGGGDANSNSWFSLQTSNMRLICVFDSPITFDEIRVNNFHNSGSLTNRGSKNVQINISTDAITSTVYDEAIANSTLIYNSTFDEHIASNVEDEQTLTLI